MCVSPDLIPCVLEAVSNTGISSASPTHSAAVAFAFTLLAVAPSAHLPAITRFLLESSDQRTATNILRNLRSKLADYLDNTRSTGVSQRHFC